MIKDSWLLSLIIYSKEQQLWTERSADNVWERFDRLSKGISNLLGGSNNSGKLGQFCKMMKA